MSVSLKTAIKIDTAGYSFNDVCIVLRALLKKGKAVICPCCDQHAMVCKRRITVTMAYQLRRIIDNGGEMETHEIQQDTDGRQRMYSLLRHWGLIESPEPRHWMVTPLGLDFVEGKVTVPKYAFIYNNEAIAHSEEQVTFKECLETPFSLPEVFSTGEHEIKGAVDVV